jgi:hypothetical protein
MCFEFRTTVNYSNSHRSRYRHSPRADKRREDHDDGHAESGREGESDDHERVKTSARYEMLLENAGRKTMRMRKRKRRNRGK